MPPDDPRDSWDWSLFIDKHPEIPAGLAQLLVVTQRAISNGKSPGRSFIPKDVKIHRVFQLSTNPCVLLYFLCEDFAAKKEEWRAFVVHDGTEECEHIIESYRCYINFIVMRTETLRSQVMHDGDSNPWYPRSGEFNFTIWQKEEASGTYRPRFYGGKEHEGTLTVLRMVCREPNDPERLTFPPTDIIQQIYNQKKLNKSHTTGEIPNTSERSWTQPDPYAVL